MEQNFQINEAYLITFWDHCIGVEETLVKSRVLGWVYSENIDRVTLVYWSADEDNKEFVNIAKTAILDVQEIALHQE